MYSVSDRRSFEIAAQVVTLAVLSYKRLNPHLVVILVANKTDLVRARAVHLNEGRNLATKLEVKFMETSAHVDHNVDELLVGIFKQIKLTRKAAGKEMGGATGGADRSASLASHTLSRAEERELSPLHKPRSPRHSSFFGLGSSTSALSGGGSSRKSPLCSIPGVKIARYIVKRFKRKCSSALGKSRSKSCENLNVL